MDVVRRASRLLGPRPADLGSNIAARAGNVAFVAGLTCDAPADAPLARGSLDALPFQSGAFTGVLVGDASSSNAASTEIARVLQPGGRAVVASSVTSWDEALRGAGLVVERDGDVVVARKPGGANLEIPRMGILSMFVPRRWLERRGR